MRCVYERGHIVKQITEVRQERLLAFRVVEQKLHFERDVTLLDGSFELVPAEGMATQVVLTTRYVRHLYPEWLWGPIERKVVRALHGHVIDGMGLDAQAALMEGWLSEAISISRPLWATLSGTLRTARECGERQREIDSPWP